MYYFYNLLISQYNRHIHYMIKSLGRIKREQEFSLSLSFAGLSCALVEFEPAQIFMTVHEF